jgi:hypothetical protein
MPALEIAVIRSSVGWRGDAGEVLVGPGPVEDADRPSVRVRREPEHEAVIERFLQDSPARDASLEGRASMAAVEIGAGRLRGGLGVEHAQDQRRHAQERAAAEHAGV